MIRSILRGQPFGSPRWQTEVAVPLGLGSACGLTALSFPRYFGFQLL